MKGGGPSPVGSLVRQSDISPFVQLTEAFGLRKIRNYPAEPAAAILSRFDFVWLEMFCTNLEYCQYNHTLFTDMLEIRVQFSLCRP